MEPSEKKQESQTVDQSLPQLKGVIPPRLSDEEFDELLAWLKEYKKTVPLYFLEEYRKHVAEISKPPDRFRGN